MSTRPLRPHLNQIRVWVRQGRTDAWIAHQLEVTGDEIAAFKREQSLGSEIPDASESPDVAPGVEAEPNLRAEDDALIAAELEAALAEREAAEAAGESDDSDEGSSRRRRRGRRGGRGRRRPAFEASFDHGEEGYGLWLDPAIVDDAVYAEHWAGHRPIAVTISADQIVITRASETGEVTDDESAAETE
ncbi:MAG: hypothetical protein Q7R41_04275, partial [Phycisphaerales bacterium]|nr:hypothetical protein [Phycisphaerales bacterium]